MAWPGATIPDVMPLRLTSSQSLTHDRRQGERIDRKPGGGCTPLLLRTAQLLRPGAGVDCAGEGVVRPDQKTIRHHPGRTDHNWPAHEPEKGRRRNSATGC